MPRWLAASVFLALAATGGCIGGSTPYPPAITSDVDLGGVRAVDGSAVDSAAAADLGAPRDLGIDVDPSSDGGGATDADAFDADLPDADLADADLPDADLPDADPADADLVLDADGLDAAP